MPTPYNIESTLTNIAVQLALFQGPFKRSTNWYVAADDFTIAPFGTEQIGIFKSTDDGVTWTGQDQTHEYPYKNSASVFEPRAHGNTISFAFYNVPLTEIDLGSFDFSTDLFGAAITGGPAGPFLSTGNGEHLLHGTLSNGNYVVCWEKSVAGNKNGLYVALYNGAWQTPILIQATSTAFLYIELMGLVVDDSDRVHILRRDNEGGNVIYCQFVAGALSSDTIIGAVGTSVRIGYGLYLPNSDEIVWPLRGGGLGVELNLLRGTPSSAPSFTIDPIADPVDLVILPRVAVQPDQSKLYFFYYDVNPVPSDHETILYFVQDLPSGVWAGPTLFWDEITDPPTPPQAIFDDRTPYSVIIAPSPPAIAMTAGLFQPDQLGDGFCGVQFFIQGPLPNPPPPVPSAVCPTDIPRLGIPFSTRIEVTGGTAPFTFALIAGALPTGLSLNTSTGVISGTPTAFGVFSYTILVTDANDQTVTITCSFAVRDPTRTLRWQCPAPGRPGRWFPHVYADPVITHYLVEPNAAFPNDQELFMLAGGAILQSGGNTDAGADIVVIAEPGSIDNGDERAQKLYVDAMTEADQTGQISAQIRFNNSQQTGPTLLMNPVGPRQQFLENIASLMDLSLYRNISVRYTWTGGPDGPRIYAFEPSGYAQPYLSTFIVTQFINLSFPGWKHHRRLYPALISNADVIFTIKTQDDRSFVTIIPSTGGQFRIIPLLVAHGCKQLAFAYQLDGQGVPFALFPESFTVETKEWTEESYIDLAVFRT